MWFQSQIFPNCGFWEITLIFNWLFCHKINTTDKNLAKKKQTKKDLINPGQNVPHVWFHFFCLNYSEIDLGFVVCSMDKKECLILDGEHETIKRNLPITKTVRTKINEAEKFFFEAKDMPDSFRNYRIKNGQVMFVVILIM